MVRLHYEIPIFLYCYFIFTMQKATTSATAVRVATLLDPLPIDLEPAALLDRLTQLHNKGDKDNDTLGHAYYTYFYGKPKIVAQVEKPPSSSLLSMYTNKQSAPSSVNVGVVQLTPPTVYVASICDEVNSYVMRGGIIPAQVFCRVIRDIHPHELRGTYYHDTEICGDSFENYLIMVNIRLREYFSSGRSLDDVLSGMKKCLCLRMISRNIYHYRDHPAELADPAIQMLMQFYTLTNFIHASSQEVFNSHYPMILKYNQLMGLVEEFIKPEFKRFLHGNRCSFYKITQVKTTDFEVAVCDDDGTIYTLPLNTLPALRAVVLSRIRPIPPQLSSNDMVHKVQSHFLNPRTMFDEGIRFIKILMNRLKNYKTYKVPLKDMYNDLFQIYELTAYALRSLHEQRMHQVNDDTQFFTITQQMDTYNQIYHRPKLNANMVDWSVTGPPTRKRSPSRSRSPSYSRKRRRGRGGARSNKSAKKFTKPRKS
jgi:hypothetical protein